MEYFLWLLLLIQLYKLVTLLNNNIIVISVVLVLSGVVCNQLAIITNEGKMPVFIESMSIIEEIELEESNTHQKLTHNTNNPVLCDYISFSNGCNIFSIGDIAITFGLLFLFGIFIFGALRLIFTKSILKIR